MTVNFVGEGKAWYVASRNDAAFQRDFFMNIAEELNLARALDTQFLMGLPLTVVPMVRVNLSW